MKYKYDINELIGKKFGYLEILSEAPRKPYGRYVYCKCHRCGRVKKILLTYVMTGKTTACGCGHRKNLIGQKFGHLTVIDYLPSRDKRTFWLCRCDCGNITEAEGYSLQIGTTIRCKNCKPKGEKNPRYKHGMTNSRLMRIWANMKDRCYNTSNIAYKNYGARGVVVCEEWKNNAKSFFDWALCNGYNDTLTIDRIDVNGNYEPSNCRWADKKTQRNNQRNNHRVEYNGETLTIAQLAEKYNLNAHRIVCRISSGWTIEDAIEKPKGFRNTQKK